jgi:hypothetical protein
MDKAFVGRFPRTNVTPCLRLRHSFCMENARLLLTTKLHCYSTVTELSGTVRWSRTSEYISNLKPLFGYELLLLLLVFSPWAGLAGTRAQSGDRYGSGTLRTRQVLRGSLPLLSPAFRRSHFPRQMPPHPQQRERS